MYRDATNLFRVRFTLTMDYDFTKAFELFDNWYKSVDEKLRMDRISETYQELEVSKIKKKFFKTIFKIYDSSSGIATSFWFWCHQLGTNQSQSHTNRCGSFI